MYDRNEQQGYSGGAAQNIMPSSQMNSSRDIRFDSGGMNGMGGMNQSDYNDTMSVTGKVTSQQYNRVNDKKTKINNIKNNQNIILKDKELTNILIYRKSIFNFTNVNELYFIDSGTNGLHFIPENYIEMLFNSLNKGLIISETDYQDKSE